MVQVGGSVKVSCKIRIRQIDYEMKVLKNKFADNSPTRHNNSVHSATEQDVETLESILAGNDLAKLGEVSEWEVVEEGEKIMDNYMQHPNCSDFDILSVRAAASSDDFYDKTLRIILLIILRCTDIEQQ